MHGAKERLGKIAAKEVIAQGKQTLFRLFQRLHGGGIVDVYRAILLELNCLQRLCHLVEAFRDIVETVHNANIGRSEEERADFLPLFVPDGNTLTAVVNGNTQRIHTAAFGLCYCRGGFRYFRHIRRRIRSLRCFRRLHVFRLSRFCRFLLRLLRRNRLLKLHNMASSMLTRRSALPPPPRYCSVAVPFAL